MERYFYNIMHWVDRMRPQEWLLLAAVVIFVGFICLRGYGSRSGY